MATKVLHAPNMNNSTHQPKPVAQRYGMLAVQEYVKGRGWRVRCDCGVEKFVEGNHLRNNKTNSCGCNAKKAQAEKIRGRKRGHKVITRPVRKYRVFKSGVRCWVCRTFTGVLASPQMTEIVLCKRCESGGQ